jgi:hypothetical protein
MAANFLPPQIERLTPLLFSRTHRRSALILPSLLPTQIRTPATKRHPVFLFHVFSLSLPPLLGTPTTVDDGDGALEDRYGVSVLERPPRSEVELGALAELERPRGALSELERVHHLPR